jgi:hypothetical protein
MKLNKRSKPFFSPFIRRTITQNENGASRRLYGFHAPGRFVESEGEGECGRKLFESAQHAYECSELCKVMELLLASFIAGVDEQILCSLGI